MYDHVSSKEFFKVNNQTQTYLSLNIEKYEVMQHRLQKANTPYVG